MIEYFLIGLIAIVALTVITMGLLYILGLIIRLIKKEENIFDFDENIAYGTLGFCYIIFAIVIIAAAIGIGYMFYCDV